MPEYVRGKFLNGFPDDWENVYQLWQNYRSDGSRLSFHWPTAVTDSDDDIKSETTEISYKSTYGKQMKFVSPRKRAGSKTSSSVPAITEADTENPLNPNRCCCSHNSFVNPPETVSRIHSELNRDGNGMNVTVEEKKESHETNSSSLNSTDKVGAYSLKDILQEDKLQIIIDNLTNKNCSVEYIKKVVEMFDGIKYLVSYQSNEKIDSDKNNSVLQEKEISRRPKKDDRSTEENHDDSIRQSSKTHLNNLQNPTTKVVRGENASLDFGNSFASSIAKKSYKGQHDGQARRILMKRNSDSSESENDCYSDNRRPATYRLPSSYKPLRRSPRYNKNYQDAIATRTSVRQSEPEKSLDVSHGARECNMLSASRSNIHDSSLSEEEPVVDKRVEQKIQYTRAFASPRKCRNAEKYSRRKVNYHDSSISITDEESDYLKKLKPKDANHSIVECSSISRDGHGDTRGEGKGLETLNSYPVSNCHSVQPDSRGNFDISGNREKLESSKNPETILRSVDPVTNRKTSKQETPREAPDFAAAMAADPPPKTPTNNSAEINNFATEQDVDFAHLSSEIKRVKKFEVNCDAVETNSRKMYTATRSNDRQLVQPSENSEMPAPKKKSPQVRKKPVVLSCELTNINLKSHDWLLSSGGNENDKNACNTRRDYVDRSKINPASHDAKNAPVSQKTSVDTLSEPKNIAGPTIATSTKNETKEMLNAPDSRSLTTENNFEKAGTQFNSKRLTAWVPAVVCDDQENSKYHLVFKGKLLKYV